MNKGRASFGLRVVLALASMVGFYVLAAGIAFGLLGAVWAEWAYAERIHLKLALVAVVGAGAILKGCFFLSDGWTAPGPELTRQQHPRLFERIEAIAGRMGARMPAAIYLVPDVNAWVAEVGGWMGIFGSRRVMGIGVGLLNVDSVSQFDAVVAHEFGHFEGGDTRLGGFLYRTRASIGRVIGNLGEDAWLSKPFRWYGKLYLRITHALGRRQELEADGWSVRIAGREAHVDGLRREAVGGVLFERFLRHEVGPLADEGFVPDNLFEGYRRYLANLEADGVSSRLEEALGREATDPFDTHPALAERIAWARALPEAPCERNDALSRSLLSDPDAVERAQTEAMLSRVTAEDGSAPRVVSWDEVAETVYAPRFERFAAALDTVGLASFDRHLSGLEAGGGDALALALDPELESLPREDRGARVRSLLVNALGARLAGELRTRCGCVLATEPGRPVVIRTADGQALDPFDAVGRAVDDPAEVPALRRNLEALGLWARSAA